MNNLLPCPFCGSTNLVEEATGGFEFSGNTYQDCWIECADCGASGPTVCVTDSLVDRHEAKDYQAVRDRWNVCIDRKKIKELT
jgi:Lar family restriction alleviation protein